MKMGSTFFIGTYTHRKRESEEEVAAEDNAKGCYIDMNIWIANHIISLRTKFKHTNT